MRVAPLKRPSCDSFALIRGNLPWGTPQRDYLHGGDGLEVEVTFVIVGFFDFPSVTAVKFQTLLPLLTSMIFVRFGAGNASSKN
jgi:hypothetical protein